MWIAYEAIVAATKGNRCSAPHITTPVRIAAETLCARRVTDQGRSSEVAIARP